MNARWLGIPLLCMLASGCGGDNDARGEKHAPLLFDQVDWDQQERIDRVGRPLLSLLFIDALATAAGFDHAQMLDAYNAGSPDAAKDFIEPIAGTLSLLDAADGHCGNQLGATGQASATRYLPLATLLADDRLYLSQTDDACNGFFGLEQSELGGQDEACGGRTPNDPAVDLLYSAAVAGDDRELAATVSDGLTQPEQVLSDSPPFLAAEE
jgi:hypothetical protein